MGTPIPWPVDTGACPTCWAEGKPFHQYITPWYVQVTVTGIVKGPGWTPDLPDPPNGLFELEYTDSCYWTLAAGLLIFALLYTPGSTTFSIYIPFPQKLFGGIGGDCLLSLPNDFPDWPDFWLGGNASWTWLGGP